MTKQEIEKMFNTCNNYHSCALCPYNPEDISRFIGDKWVGGCPDYDRKLVYAMSKGYRKGYRKVEKVRKETAKEILQRVVTLCKNEEDFQDGHVNTQLEPLFFGIANGCAYIRGEVEKIAKEYGVEDLNNERV